MLIEKTARKERAPTKKKATCTVDYRSTTCVGISTIRLRSIKSSLPFSLPLRHSRDELFQALYRFSILQATESWAGPGNEANLEAVWPNIVPTKSSSYSISYSSYSDWLSTNTQDHCKRFNDDTCALRSRRYNSY